MHLRFWAAAALFFAITARGINFSLPADFQIERVDKDARFPMFAARSGDGRLFLAESSGLDLYAELQKQTRRCRIRALSGRDRNGKFERSVIFAEGLVFPMGLAWRDGKLFAADPPDLIALEDLDNDGRADKRTVLLTGFGHTDNGSLHGLVFGPDGWLYMTMGQPDGYRFKLADGSILEGKSGALLRCRPDGTGIEVVCRGFENLVEVVFLPEGEIVGTDNWFSLPQDGVRDALVHLVPGGVYPLNAHARAEAGKFYSGELLPAISLYPAVALSGLARYEGSRFPLEMRGDLFSAQFNTRKVVRHKLARNGATFRSEDHEFLSTDDPDFHPSDVLEDSDGSLIIIDTGSWYVHHCPTGRIRQAPAQGGVYRVSYQGILRGTEPEKLPPAGTGAPGSSPRAEASVPELLEAVARAGTDPFARHAAIYALHRVADTKTLRHGLGDRRSEVRRAAVILLDQSPHHALAPEDAVSAVSDSHPDVRQAAIAAFRNHADWMPQAVDRACELLAAGRISEDAADLAAITLNSSRVQEIIAAGIRDPSRAPEARVRLIEIARDLIRGESPPWRESVRSALRSKDVPVVAAALRLKFRDGFEDELSAILRDPAVPDDLRLESLRARRQLDSEGFEFALSKLRPAHSPALRLAAAEIIAAAAITTAQFEQFFALARNDNLIARSLILSAAAKQPASPAIEQYQAAGRPRSGDQAQLIERVLTSQLAGDENRGQQLFLGKAGCSACHRVGKTGGLVGPDLTRIGAIRARRDLIESLAAPSATIAQGYDAFRVELLNGEILSGVRVRQLDDSFGLREASGSETRLRAEEIRKVEPSEVSVMPEGLFNALSDQEAADLLAYLQRLK